MTPEKSLRLPPVPLGVANDLGHPRFGTYSGELGEVDFSRLTGAYHVPLPLRPLKRKSWQYTFVATQEIIALFAVADLRYTGNAFVTVVDLRERRPLLDVSFLGAPGLFEVSDHPGEGFLARFRTLGGKFFNQRKRGEDHYLIDVDLSFLRTDGQGSFSWKGDVLAANGPPALTVIAPVKDGVVNVTQKWAGLLASGTLRVGSREFSLDGGVAGMDYTNGYLARHTSWRWAFANGRLPDGTPLGLNLVEGFNEDNPDANENALWVGRELIPLDRARFEFNKQDVLAGWKVRTLDGSVDLTFTPIHAHRDERDYVVLKSHFAQPVGLFEGTLRIHGHSVSVKGLPGVTEDQDMLW